MIMKLCYQDFVYLYHGRKDLSDLKYHIKTVITQDQVILKWCDKDNETITIKRNDDLQYILKNESGVPRINIKQSDEEKQTNYIPTTLNKNFSFAPQFTLQKPQQLHNYPLKKSESIEIPIDQVCEQIVEEQMNKIYPGFNQYIQQYIQQPFFNINNPMEDQLTRMEEIKPVMIKSQNIQFKMRESITQKKINREQYEPQSGFVSVTSPQKMLGFYNFQRGNLYCDNCSNKIEEKGGFYSCHICSDFDICIECQENNCEYNLHEHQLEFTDEIREQPKTEILKC